MGLQSRTSDDRFHASGGSQPYVISGSLRVLRVVIRERHSVKSYDLQYAAIELQVQIAVRRGVDDAPELALFRRDLDLGAKGSVYGKNLFNRLSFSSATLGWDFNVAHQCGGVGIMLNGASTHHHHPLSKTPHLGDIALYSFDDDGS